MKTVTLTVTMEWNETAKKWLMYLNSHFIHDFWDCKTVHNVFKDLNKETKEKYEITIEHKEK